MAIYYKFKSSKDYSFVPIAGLHISVADLKQCIVQAKCLGGTDYDLLITNAQTNEDYNDEKTLIHRNTSVILRRVPGLPRQQIVVPQEHSSKSANVDAKVNAVAKPGCKTKIADVFTWSKIGIPPEVLCPLCQIIMKDAVLPRKCCFQSFCHRCIRENIISKNMCACGATNILIEDLVPNYALRKVIMCISESSSSGSSSGTSEESLHVQNSESARSTISEEPLLKGPSNTLGEITPVANVDQRKIASTKPGKTKACSPSKSDPYMSVYNSTTSAMSWDTGCMTGGHMPSPFYTPKSFGDSLAGAYWQVPYWSHAYMMDAPIPSETLKCGENSEGTNVVAAPSMKEKPVLNKTQWARGCPATPAAVRGARSSGRVKTDDDGSDDDCHFERRKRARTGELVGEKRHRSAV